MSNHIGYGYYGGANIADILNIWNDLGVFSYVIPFLLIFAVIFGILDKTKLFQDKENKKKNKTIEAIIAASIGLLSLQFDFVPEFFAIIFPRFGIGISVFIVALIILTLVHPFEEGKVNKAIAPFAWLVAVGTIIWAFSEWDQWGYYGGFGGWFAQNIWALIVLGAIIAVIVVTARGDKPSSSGGSG